jgi:hypothetical protein
MPTLQKKQRWHNECPDHLFRRPRHCDSTAQFASLALDYAAQGREFSDDDLQTMGASAGRLFRFAQRMEAGL